MMRVFFDTNIVLDVLLQREPWAASAREAVQICLEAFEICEVNRLTLELANQLTGTDFEDNLQIACAIQSGLEAIVTRNSADFTGTQIPVLSALEAVQKVWGLA